MKKILLILLMIIMLPITVKAESKYLYDVLKNEAENNGLAKEYTGEHHDSFTKEPSKKIYHWYAETDEEGNQVLGKSNVIFAGFCWEMIRTTDTGGIKLMYIGVPNNNKCTYINSIGRTSINYSESVAAAGYMYNPNKDVKQTGRGTVRGQVYGTDVEYNNGNYTLTDIVSELDENHHYSCANETGECSIVRYYFDLTNNNYYYTELADGKNIEEAINEALYSEDVNQEDSKLKIFVDTWYENNMVEYTKYLEDTIFCNDRGITDLGVFNPHGGGLYNNVATRFNNYLYNTDLSCERITDQFSVSNSKAKLKYPVGLMTKPEMVLLNNNVIRNKNTYYWLLSPDSFQPHTSNFSRVNTNGTITRYATTVPYYVLPAISLKANTKYSSGDGSKENPYIVDLNNYYKVIVEESVKNGDIVFETEDISNLQEGEEVKFKITPVKGYILKDLKIIDEEENNVEYTTPDNINFKFTMPATDVTIKPQYKEINIPNNPNTKRQILLIVISVIILSIMTFIYFKKKKHKN